MDFFLSLRDNDNLNLEKPLSTAELLSWMLAMSNSQSALDVARDCGAKPSTRWRRLAAHCLLKLETEQARIGELIKGWHQARP